MADKPRGKPLNEGYTPSTKGHEPRKVQGGYVPSASANSGSAKPPPKWNSGAKPPKK